MVLVAPAILSPVSLCRRKLQTTAHVDRETLIETVDFPGREAGVESWRGQVSWTLI